MPGDQIFIPDLREKSMPCATAKRTTFRRRGVPIKVAFTIADQTGEPFVGKIYKLTVGAAEFNGRTDDAGHLKHWVATSEKLGRLVVQMDTPNLPETLEWILDIGQLPPYKTKSGMQLRLNNLGYAASADDQNSEQAIASALRQFQRDHDLPETGNNDDATLNALRDAHGS